MLHVFEVFKIPKVLVVLIKNLSYFLSFWLYGPLGISQVFVPDWNNFIQLGKSFIFSAFNEINNTCSALKSAVITNFRFLFCEVFIVGKGYRFERVRYNGVVLHGVRLYMGLRSIFRLFLPQGSAVVGINKRKIVLCHKSAQQLNNFAQMVQMLKKPAKFYRQGVSLRFRIRKTQNFRHKKRK